MKKKIPKRDERFQDSLLFLPDEWIENYEFLVFKNKINYALAAQWRPEIYYTQRHLWFSIIMAYTNNHKNVHDKFSRMAIKAYFLTFGCILLPACWDKLAQLLREFFEIKEWSHLEKPKKATEKNTYMETLISYLNSKSCSPIRSALEKYWKEKEKKDAYELARQIKHRLSYFETKAVDEKVLYKDIAILKKANNSFVKCALEIDELINFKQFYKRNEVEFI